MLAGLMDRSWRISYLERNFEHLWISYRVFEKQASKQLVLEFSSEFWLNKYFEKELIKAFTVIASRFLRRFLLFSRGNQGSLIFKYKHAGLFVFCRRNQILGSMVGDVLNYGNTFSALQELDLQPSPFFYAHYAAEHLPLERPLLEEFGQTACRNGSHQSPLYSP
jgi:hypothetical protein